MAPLVNYAATLSIITLYAPPRNKGTVNPEGKWTGHTEKRALAEDP